MSGDGKGRRRSVSIRNESYAKLTAYAQQQGMSRSGVMEKWIAEHLGADAPDTTDVMVRGELFNCLQDYANRQGVSVSHLVETWVGEKFSNTLVEVLKEEGA